MRQDTLRSRAPRDAVDAIVGQWRTQRPDLDASAKHITGRIVRLASIFHEAYDEQFAPLEIAGSEYGVLSALRRAGEPFELTPTELARHQMMTSGGMTSALDRLERKGLASRARNPADRRGTLVRLTETGRDVIEAAMARHAEAEHALVSQLNATERAQLQTLLRKLLLAVDPR